MKYLSTILLIILTWLVVDEFILKRNESGRKYSIIDRWKDLGARIHSVIGILALVILIIYTLRLVVYVFF
ncbi:MAG: hypothetical protein WCP72_00700 [Desulfomonile sp.]|jgi:hypothetical protein